MSMQTIIIAIIALIVLIVLILIFTGQIGGFGNSLQNCVELGGKCTTDVDCQVVKGNEECSCRHGILLPSGDCGTGMACCKDIFKQDNTNP